MLVRNRIASGLQKKHGRDLPQRSDKPPERQPKSNMPGQSKLPLPTSSNQSPSSPEETQGPSPRHPTLESHEMRPIADSDTLPARWRDDGHSAEEATRNTNQRQPTTRGARSHSQRSISSYHSTLEDDDKEEAESGSRSGSSLGGSLVRIEKPEEQNHHSDVIEHEGAEGLDDDGYVRISHDRSPSRG